MVIIIADYMPCRNHSSMCNDLPQPQVLSMEIKWSYKLPDKMEFPHILCIVVVKILISLVASQKMYANYSGDIMLAGFFPIHTSVKVNGVTTCGEILEEDGIQPMEAFFQVSGTLTKLILIAFWWSCWVMFIFDFVKSSEMLYH